MLSVLDNYTLDNPDEIAKEIANDFRKRRIEKNLTREQVSEKAGVAVSNIVRFEQKGLISLKHLFTLRTYCVIVITGGYIFKKAGLSCTNFL